MSATLLVSAAMAFASAGIYGFIGQRISQRKVAEEARLAADLFSAWWYGLAIVTLVGGLMSTAGALGLRDVNVYAAATFINLFGLTVALWGLLYYLVYLWTGRRGALVPLTLFYVAFFILLAYYVLARHPTGVNVGTWNVTLEYASTASGPLFTTLLLLLVLPQILAGFAYFALFFRVHDRTARYRIALVSWSIILWFSSPLIASATAIAGTDTWNVASRLIGLTAALLILAAYRPPRFVRERYGVRPVDPEVSAPA